MDEIQKAENLYSEGKLEEAISLFEAVIEKKPDSYESYNNIGVIYYEQGDINKAEDSFKKALSIKEDYQDALLNIADYYQSKKDFLAAAKYLEKVLIHRDRDSDIYNRIGVLYLEAGNEERALKILKRSLEIEPDQDHVKESVRQLERKIVLSQKNDRKIKILHIMQLDKFLPPFIDFVDDNFGRKDHHYAFVETERYDYGLTPEHGVEFFPSIDDIFITLKDYMYEAEKIIIHGLWKNEICILLYYNQDLLKKCYWVMWGGDYYFPERHPLIKKQVIKNMGHAIVRTRGNYELIKKWYGSKAEHHECFSYLSNVVEDYSYLKGEYKNNNDKKLILIGNSADPTNNHLEILDRISIFKNDNIEIICPLSYGDRAYAEKVISAGNTIFSSKFIPLTQFIPKEEYLKILMTVDVAVFAHKRTQAMGTIRTLLGMGKKVYLRDDITSWPTFGDINVKVYSFNNEKIDFIFPEHFRNENIKNMKDAYSYEKLLFDWERIFNWPSSRKNA